MLASGASTKLYLEIETINLEDSAEEEIFRLVNFQIRFYTNLSKILRREYGWFSFYSFKIFQLNWILKRLIKVFAKNGNTYDYYFMFDSSFSTNINDENNIKLINQQIQLFLDKSRYLLDKISKDEDEDFYYKIRPKLRKINIILEALTDRI